jgi:signal transduction histidine kinase/ActR/RegA family two-component response regulator
MRVNIEVTLIAAATGLVIFTLLMLRWSWRRFRRRERRAISGLQVARNRIHSLFSQVGFMAFSVDTEGVLTWVEGADVSGIGLSTERSTGRHYTEVFERDPKWQREIRIALKGESTTRRVTNHDTPYQLSIRPVFDSDGRTAEAVAVIVDITDEIRETDRADRLARFRSEFLSAMNHRLRAPLSGIVGVTGLLARSELGEDERESVDVIQQSSDTLLHFIDDLIDYGELDAGRLELDIRPFDLQLLIEGVSTQHRDAATHRGLALVARYPHEAAQHFLGDAPRIRQIVSNLVSNAIEFTEQGHVLLDIHESERQVSETTIAISIEDTGHGIPNADVEHIFEGFGASAIASSDRPRGTGLGLAISRQLANLMGGDLTVTSRLGLGTKFTLTIDLERTLAVQDAPPSVAPRAAAAGPAPSAVLGAAGSTALHPPRRALVAEDSLVQQKVVERMLRSIGLEVRVASNGLEAVEALEAAAYDIVFMDCQMPELDGFEATARIRDLDGERSNVPIVAMTADAMPGDRERCLNAGMSDYLSKPVNLEDLQQAAERWIAQEQAAAAVRPPTGEGGSGSTEIAGPSVDAIDLAPLRELDQLEQPGGDSPTALVTDLIDAILSTAPAQLIGTRDGVTGNSLATIEYWLTPYRTSCRLIGVGRSESLAGDLLEQARSGDFFAAEQTLGAIEREFPQIKQELLALREQRISAA